MSIVIAILVVLVVSGLVAKFYKAKITPVTIKETPSIHEVIAKMAEEIKVKTPVVEVKVEAPKMDAKPKKKQSKKVNA